MNDVPSALRYALRDRYCGSGLLLYRRSLLGDLARVAARIVIAAVR